VCNSRADKSESECANKGAGNKVEGAEVEGEERDTSKVIKINIKEEYKEEDISIRIDL
jgi:hypothetical protein